METKIGSAKHHDACDIIGVELRTAVMASTPAVEAMVGKEPVMSLTVSAAINLAAELIAQAPEQARGALLEYFQDDLAKRVDRWAKSGRVFGG